MKLITTIKDERTRQGFTQAEFARMCGISQPYYNKVERGHIAPGIDLVEKMMLKLNLKIARRTADDVNKDWGL